VIPLEEHYVIQTPEGVSIYLILAGIGSRVLAFTIDFFIMTAALIVVVAATILLGLIMANYHFSHVSDVVVYAIEAIICIYIFLVYFGYFVLFEVFGGGRSPGKRIMGLRVVRSDGGAVGFRTSLLRNLLRIVDSSPSPTYLVGLVLVFFTKRHQRLGDLAAGTIVIRERPGDRNALTGSIDMAAVPTSQDPQQLQYPQLRQQPLQPQPQLQLQLQQQPQAHLPYGWDLTGLSPQELRLVEEFLKRRWSLDVQARAAWGNDLARHVRAMVLAPGAPSEAEGFLEAVAYVKHVAGS
jgi:uncharacterized RDD family membrane protein YckC